MKYLLTLALVINFLNIEGIFFINEDKVYWNRLGDSIGMISSDDCIWFDGQEVQDCNFYTRNYLEIKQREYEEAETK